MDPNQPHQRHIIISATSDLVTDQRVQRAAYTMKDLGFSVTLLGRKLSNSLPIEIPGIKVIRFKFIINTGVLFYALYNIRLFIYLLTHSFTHLLSNDLDTLAANGLASKIKGGFLIYDSHEYFTGVPEIQNRPLVKKVWELIEKICIRSCDAVFTVNESIAQIYRNKYQINVDVIRNVPVTGITLPRGKSKDEIREKLKIKPEEKVVILQGAGINIDRGAEEAVEAMTYTNHIRLVIIGGGDVIHKLNQMVADNNLEDKVTFLPKMPYNQLINYTAAADAGLTFDKGSNPNYLYSLPNKLFDYIKAGIPVLASRLPELEKIIEKYDIGMFIENHDPRHIAEMIDKMFIDDKRIEYWKNNLILASKELNWENESKSLIRIINSIEKK